DFNGDGVAEVVYRDECWLRVLSGPDGRTLFAAGSSSSTGLELPVVADVDGDGTAEIVVSADDRQPSCSGLPEPETGAPWTGPKRGVFVYEDPLDRWMPSRAVWNQHAYHVTNIG